MKGGSGSFESSPSIAKPYLAERLRGTRRGTALVDCTGSLRGSLPATTRL